jgi:hypothetical protein
MVISEFIDVIYPIDDVTHETDRATEETRKLAVIEPATIGSSNE